jgi:CBS domain-containing protein
MALTVSEIMNREVFSVGPAESVAATREAILALGITGVPVVDVEGRPLGLVSLRDLVRARGGATAGERMTQPPATVPEDVRLGEAARRLARTRYHRLIVVDGRGCVVGMVSAVDIIRGLMGLPAPHPASFPHLDRESGLSWTDDLPLELDEIHAAPDGPGVLVLLHGGAGVAERVLWAESAESIRHRLKEMLTTVQPGLLGVWLEHGGLRFRAASATDPAERSDALAAIRRGVAMPPVPDLVAGSSR